MTVVLGRVVNDTGVEALVQWAYNLQQVAGMPSGAAFEGGLAGPGYSTDGCVRMMQLGALGAIVQGGQWRSLTRDSDPDAEAVHDVVMALPDRAAAGLVIACGRARGQPDWRPAPHFRLRPLGWRTVDGERLAYEENVEDDAPRRAKRGSGDNRLVWWCPVVPHDVPEVVVAARAAYRRWWGALDVLRVTLRRHRAALRRWRVTEAMPPELPWLSPELVARASLAGRAPADGRVEFEQEGA